MVVDAESKIFRVHSSVVLLMTSGVIHAARMSEFTIQNSDKMLTFRLPRNCLAFIGDSRKAHILMCSSPTPTAGRKSKSYSAEIVLQ